MKHNILFGLFITLCLGVIVSPVWMAHNSKQNKIKQDGCPPIGARVGWLFDKTLVITGHSGTPNYVYAHEDGFYGSSTYSCGDLKVLPEVEK